MGARSRKKLSGKLSIVVLAGACFLRGQGAEFLDVQKELQELREQNKRLQEQLQRQQTMIDSLSNRVTNLPASSIQINDGGEEKKPGMADALMEPFAKGRFHIGGTAGIGFFHTTREGQTPNAEFKIDEARLFLEAKLYENIYFFSEINLTTREADQERLELGELYVDFENLSRFLGRDRWLNLRVGRFDIPFGEEYLLRDALDNPLITHSLMDFWGIDEGVEIYGGGGNFNFVFAAQNGGHPLLRDYDRDKALIGRLSYDPAGWLHLSVSGMRTGDLSVQGDKLSELWFGNGFIRNIGPLASRFAAEVFQGDAQLRFRQGHLKFTGGYLQTDDDDPVDFSRDAVFYAVEGLYSFTDKFYGASRFSHIIADGGLPIVGFKNFSRFMFNNAYLTENIWRISAGLGYRLSRNVVFKGEYALEEYSLTFGPSHTTSFLGAEIAVGF